MQQSGLEKSLGLLQEQPQGNCSTLELLCGKWFSVGIVLARWQVHRGWGRTTGRFFFYIGS